ncbi:MAG: hypothetical protein VB860_12290 [Dehalococcoidia bacterium]
MRKLINRIAKHYLGFVALLFLVGATACEQLIQEGAREAAESGREIRDLNDAEIRPLQDRIEAIQFDQIEPLQREIEDLNREIERIQRLVIEPLWNNIQDPWSPGGELYEAQEALQRQYELLDEEYRRIEIDQRVLEREYRDSTDTLGGFDPLVRQQEDKRYDLQRELDRLYRFGQDPIDEVWNQVNSLNSNPGGTWDSSQFEIDQLNNKVVGLYDEANWLQSDLDNRIREKEDLRTNVQNELNDHHSFGRFEIDPIFAEILRLENELTEGTVVTVSEVAGSSDEIDALRAERDDLINALSADLAQLDADISSAVLNRDDAAAPYQATIDAKNQEISLLSTSTTTDTTASSTTETTLTDNSAQIATLQSEIDQAVLDRDAAVAPLNEIVNALQADRNALSATRQPTIDELNTQIFELQSAEVETVTTTSIPEGVTEELITLRNKLALLEEDFNATTDKLQGLLSSIENELNELYSFGNAPVEQIYRDIETINAQITDYQRVSEQDQLEKNDAVNSLAAQAEILQNQLNADIRYLEEQLFNIDDELQRLYRVSNDDNYDSQIVFNQAQRALEDRRYDLDDQRWLIDQEQQDLYSKNVDPWRDVQVKADLIYASEIQPLQDRIVRIDDEIGSLWEEIQSIERQMRSARRGIEDRERELEDKAFDFLDRIADGETKIDDGLGFDPIGEPFIEEPFDPISDFVDDPDGLGDFDPSLITDEPVLDPEVIDDTTEAPVNADGTVADPVDAPVDPEPTDGTLTTEPVVEPVQ